VFQVKIEKEKKFEEIHKVLRDGLFPIEVDIIESLHHVYCAGVNANARCLGDGAGSGKTWETEHWTSGILQALSTLGESHGFLVYPNHDKKTGKSSGEWLFDHVWVDAERDGSGKIEWKKTRGLALACESEWENTEYAILTNFYKLTFATADLRLFIYSNKKIGSDHPVDICKAACPLSKGFRYLLVGFPYLSRTGDFRVDAWTV